METNNELKNCPCCSEKAEIFILGETVYNPKWYKVVCNNFECRCSSDYCVKEQEAIDAWNKRVETETLRELLKEVKPVIDYKCTKCVTSECAKCSWADWNQKLKEIGI